MSEYNIGAYYKAKHYRNHSTETFYGRLEYVWGGKHQAIVLCRYNPIEQKATARLIFLEDVRELLEEVA